MSTRPAWLQPSLPKATDLSDRFQWAKDYGIYLDGEVLKERVLSAPQTVLVLDSRDDDAVGGHIAGALHWPDSTFDDRFKELLGIINERRTLMLDLPGGTGHEGGGGHLLVVFHCMESARRGPRCAHKLYNYLSTASGSLSSTPCPVVVKVLIGGADRWLRKNYKSSALVDDFDDRYWGWEEEPVTAGEEQLPSHVLYHRPADQTHGSDHL
jgi:rhodanese-related sulfurtransferase